MILTLNYAGCFILFDEPYNLITEPVRTAEAKPTNKMRMNTIMFTTYFLMNMVNSINSRVIDDNEINVFKTLFNNSMFWLVFLLEMGLTHFMLFLGKGDFGSFGPTILGVTEISIIEYIICWVLALLSIPLNILSKKVIPIKPFQDLCDKFDLEP